MKTIITIFYLTFFFQFFSIGQTPFFKEGAKWILTNESHCGIGYQIFDYMGDTLIEGHNVKVIRSHFLNFVFKFSDYRESKSRNFYFLQKDNQLVSIISNWEYLDSTNWQKIIFDREANVGDTIMHAMKPERKTKIMSPYQYTIIDSIKTETIDNTPLKTWYGTLQCGISNSKITSVVFNEWIGDIFQPISFYQWKCRKEENKIPKLLYYSDKSGFEYNPFDEYKAYKKMKAKVENPKYFYDELQIDNSKEKLDLIKLYPNPAKTQITLELKEEIELENLSIEIHGMDCKSIKQVESVRNSVQEIDISSLTSGSYIFLIKENGRYLDVESFIVQ